MAFELAELAEVSEAVPTWPQRLSPRHLDRLDVPTPFLAVDPLAILARYDRLAALVPGLSVFYAVKCNAAPEVLGTLAGHGSGFEVASAQELEVLRHAGVAPERVLYSNPVKPPAHIEAAHRRGVRRFAFDSVGELRKLAAVAPGASDYARLRVDDGRSLFPLPRKFGTSAEEACRLLLLARDLGLDPYGVTFHVGSQCTDPGAWRRAIGRCAVVMHELERRRVRLRMVDIGGGLPARYTDPVPDVEEIAAVVREALAGLPYQPEVLAAEPGRHLVAEAAVLVASVIGLEERDGERWAYLDVGAYNGLMEAMQTGGRWLFPLRTSRLDDSTVPHVPCTVTGPSCDSSDTLFYDAHLPATLDVGDRVYIGSAGAYTLSYASHFNGFPPPAVAVVGRVAPLAA